jgi:uncharacterized membrane protein (UPF0127 family)
MLLKINNNKFNVKLAISPDERSEGMMNKKFNEEYNGMLFVEDESDVHCFWMKNCIISLDIIFIQKGTITKIHENCPPCVTDSCETYCGYGNLVLEVAGGTCAKLGIKKGDKMTS